MTRRTWYRLADSLGMVLLLAAPAAGQILYGSLVGRVTDESRSAIPNAEITATNTDTGVARNASTNAEGLYSLPNLDPGNYTVKVSQKGFVDAVHTQVIVGVNTTVRVDAVLKVAGVQSAVTVSAVAEAAQLQTERGEVRHELGAKEFEDLPVSLAGNYQGLLLSLPGVEMEGDFRQGRLGGTNSAGSVAFSVNGTTTSTTVTNLDGASNSHIWDVGKTAVVPTIDSVESVIVTTNSFDAEVGLAGGAVISVQSKSGTNQIRGSAFENHYNQTLRAREFFLPEGERKGKFISNRYGGTLGGPIVRNKLFFFTSYGGRAERDNGSKIFSLPSPAVRAGDFSGFTNPVYDPSTGAADGFGRVPFAGNRIPASRVDPIAKKIIDLVPLPNLPELLDANANNFFASRPFKADRWALDSKVNWQASNALTAFVSWNYARFRTRHLTAFGEGYMDGPRVGAGNAGDAWGYNTRISTGATYVFSPTLLADAFFGWTRQNTNVEQPGVEKNYGLDVLGIPGTNGPARFQGGWPKFAVSGYTAFGTEEAYSPYYRNDNQYSLRTNMTNTRGKHEIRWGVDINSEQMNHIQPEFQGGASTGARGLFNFGTGTTAACLARSATGACSRTSSTTSASNAFASLLLGLPNQVGKNLLTVYPYTTRTWRYSLYLRDRWQAHRSLTLSYGVRWEYFPMPARADRGFERYNPEDNMMYIGGVGSVPRDLGVRTSKKLFAPRFGFAYRAGSNLVFRGGYGISYDPYSLARALRTNHPILIELVVPAPNTLAPASTLAAGIPPIPVPSLGNGVIEVPANVSTQTVMKNMQRGYIQSWNFTAQRRVRGGFLVEAGYVATRQIRQLGYRQLNWAPIGGGNAGKQLYQKFGRSADTREVGPIGGSHYDSLQVRAQRRFSRGYSFTAAYTFGKSISSSGLDRSDSTLKIVIPEYYNLNRSVSAYSRRHNLQFTNITSLPFGKRQRFLKSGALSRVVGNWQVNNVIALMSGRPFSITASATSLNAPNNTQRADQVLPEVKILGGVGRGQSYFDPLAYKPVSEPRFGTAGFNSLYGPGRVNWDCSLFRHLRVSEKVRMELRMEAYNFTNTPKFGMPGANVSNLQLNPDGSIRNLNGFTEITTATEERQFAFGIRFTF